MLRNLLCPVDGSPLAEQALPYALGLAQKAGATLHIALVHVPNAYGEYFPSHTEDLEEEAKTCEQKYLDGLRDRLASASRVNIDVHHLEGIVPETLTAEVADRQIDLVIMAAHGWGYVSRAIVGSVSDHLIRHLTIPLLIVHAPEIHAQLEVNRPTSFRRVLVPLDGSKLAETIIAPARSLGDLWRAAYRLVRVVVPPSRQYVGWPPDEAAPTFDERALEQAQGDAATYLEQLAARVRQDDLAADVRVVVERNVAAAIIKEAAAGDCDVIAIATHGRGGLSRLLLGSVADKVVRGASVPVLICQAASATPS
ncbi:MAG: universal stress protein [Planctomycetia bacterium]|nr:universal stress protein [Planctomycetia bacterium]